MIYNGETTRTAAPKVPSGHSHPADRKPTTKAADEPPNPHR